MKEKITLGLLGVVTILTVINSYKIFIDNEELQPAQNAATHSITNSNIQVSGTQNDQYQNHNNIPEPLNVAPTRISFDEYEHDFGTVRQQSESVYEFEFKNTGNKPLIVQHAKGSCGCTVPEWPKEPIAPGASGKIKVIYSSRGTSGKQSKKVSVIANTEPRVTELVISANVVKAN